MKIKELRIYGTPLPALHKLNNTVKSRLGPQFTSDQANECGECQPLRAGQDRASRGPTSPEVHLRGVILFLGFSCPKWYFRIAK